MIMNLFDCVSSQSCLTEPQQPLKERHFMSLNKRRYPRRDACFSEGFASHTHGPQCFDSEELIYLLDTPSRACMATTTEYLPN